MKKFDCECIECEIFCELQRKFFTKFSLSEKLKNVKMIEKPDIARGFVLEGKTKVVPFWENIKQKLNCIGSPIKTTQEWRLYQKMYLWKSATTSIQHRTGTGGGAYKEYKFSPSEETVLEILGTKEAPDGIEGTRTFGLKITRSQDETKDLLTCEENLEPRINQTNLDSNDITIKQTNSCRKLKKKLCDEM